MPITDMSIMWSQVTVLQYVQGKATSINGVFYLGFHWLNSPCKTTQTASSAMLQEKSSGDVWSLFLLSQNPGWIGEPEKSGHFHTIQRTGHSTTGDKCPGGYPIHWLPLRPAVGSFTILPRMKHGLRCAFAWSDAPSIVRFLFGTQMWETDRGWAETYEKKRKECKSMPKSRNKL